jgi:integrase
MRGKLTNDSVHRLSPASKDYFLWDSIVMGLGVRVKASGAKAFVVQYRRGSGRSSTTVRITIDRVGSISLDDARKAARALLGRVAKGYDPRNERKAAKLAENRKVRAVIGAYDRDFELRRVSPYHRKNTISVLKRGLDKVMHRDLASLTRQELISVINSIQKRGARQSFRQRLTPMINYAVNEGLVAHNVLAGWVQPRRSRDMSLQQTGRALTTAEIAAVWEATKVPTNFHSFVRVMMLTGLRKTETASMEWSWIDNEARAIVLPAFRMKSGRPHTVPLTDQLNAVLNSIVRSPSTSLLFPTKSRTGSWTTMSGFGQMLAKLQSRSGAKGWTLHDLRRTYRTFLGEMGFDIDLSERMLSHKRDSLIEQYDKSSRWPERVAAAQVIANTISAASIKTLGAPARSQQ